MNEKRKLLVFFLSLTVILSSATAITPGDEKLNYMTNEDYYTLSQQNEIEDSNFQPLKPSSRTSEAVSLLRSLVDPNDQYGDIWQAVGRQARQNDLTDMAYEVFKEMLSEFLFGSVGSLFGIENRRTGNPGIFELIVGAIRKHTIQKKMGCP